MTNRARTPCIYVLAGANGAGKSSIGGAMFLESGAEYFNPDEAALRYRATNPGMTQEEANGAAWRQGKRLLERAISERLDFAFEITLGGHAITRLLDRALSEKMEVHMWYVSLASSELHVSRVRARVAAGGHDIPEAKIRERYESSRLNLLDLMPKLTELRVYDNSEEADPRRGVVPRPRPLLHTDHSKIVDMCDLARTPDWAKSILVTAIKLSRGDQCRRIRRLATVSAMDFQEVGTAESA